MILEAFKKNPAATGLFLALVAATWLYYDLYEKARLSPRELLGAALFWGLLVLLGVMLRGAWAKRQAKTPPPPPAPPPGRPPLEKAASES